MHTKFLKDCQPKNNGQIIEAAQIINSLGNLVFMRNLGRKEIELAVSDFKLVYSKFPVVNTSSSGIKKLKKSKSIFNLDSLIQAPQPFRQSSMQTDGLKYL